MSAAFRCGHPKTPENSLTTGPVHKNGTRSLTCRLCHHVRNICRTHKLQQERLNEDKPIFRRPKAPL